MLGLIGINNFRSSTYCPTSGCLPYSLPAYYWLPAASFFSGIALVVAGIILLIFARGMKHRQDEEWANAQNARR